MLKQILNAQTNRKSPDWAHGQEDPGAGNETSGERTPLLLQDANGADVRFFVDKIHYEESRIYVVGWATTNDLEISTVDDGTITRQEVFRGARPDVAEALALDSDEGLGFCFSARNLNSLDEITLEICIEGETLHTRTFSSVATLAPHERALFPELRSRDLQRLKQIRAEDDEWSELVASFPGTDGVPIGHHGFVEGALRSPEGGAVVFGWALHPEETVCWLEGGGGKSVRLSDAFRRPRADILEAFRHVPWSGMNAGFIAHLPDLPHGATVQLRMATEDGVFTVNEGRAVDSLPPDPRLAAEKLFSLETEAQAFQLRAPVVDWPVLSPLIARRNAELDKLPAELMDFGTLQADPDVSIIVPLYKRYDFMEHQLLALSRDPEVPARYELIYVVDDPAIRNEVLSEANRLSELLDVPFRVLSGTANRGFSGANNLGASHASANVLLFLNSDVIPQQPGWADAMLRVLAQDDDAGIVGARLLFPDGSLQHAGMEFRRDEQWGIWTNQHPNAGTAPEFDPDEPREVPAVTGACLMIRRALFDEIGGWDNDYLIGDFEDSDLCLAARSRGYRVVYQPAASLTHLERQSFTGVGADWFRIRMTICNAVRHERKWKHLIERPVDTRTSKTPEARAG